MRITEKQLKQIVKESVALALNEEIQNEGKLGRALGTMALGGALMFGNAQDANAQLNVKQVVQNSPRVLLTVMWDGNKTLQELDGVYYLCSKTDNQFEKNGITATLGDSPETAAQTLSDLINLLSQKTALVTASDPMGDLTIVYRSNPFGEEYLNIEQEGRAGKCYIHKKTLDKMLQKIQEESSTYQIIPDDEYYNDPKKTGRRSVTKGKGSNSFMNR